MSTNTNHFPSEASINGLPDVAEIEKLANELFALLPNEVPKANFSPDLDDHPRTAQALNLVHDRLPSLFTKKDSFPINNPQTSLPDPHLPASAPASYRREDSTVFSQEKTGATRPDSLAGIPYFGGTQAYIPVNQQVNSLDLAQHQKSVSAPQGAGLPKQETGFGKPAELPSSVSGSGISPTAPASYTGLPLTYDHFGLPDLSALFSGIPSSTPSRPFSGGNADQYYFLSDLKLPESESLTTQNLPKVSEKSAPVGLKTIPFDVDLIKKDFPILQERVNGRPLIWLDNAATTQKPKSVIDRITYFYEHENSNIHRAAHELAARATDAYEAAREKVRAFLNAGSVNEIVFVRGATEAINLVAKTWGDQYLNAGDEIIVSNLEHHANIVPWQQLAAKKGLKLRVIPVDDDGQILLDEYAKLLTPKTKLVAFTQVSNALGTVTPARQIVELAHQAGAKVLVDGAQSVSHLRSDVRGLDADWFVFSGHKVFGPTGIGVLYGKEELLNATQPWQGGGNMIVDVTFEHTKFHDAPSRFEAGTGNIADAVGLGAAIDYVNRIGIDLIHHYEHALLKYATAHMSGVPGLRLIGTAKEKASVLSFVLNGYKTEEVGAALNKEGIAVRSGHHCAQPILRRFGLETTVRPSLAFYNTTSDIDVLVETLYRLSHTKNN